MVSRLKHPCAVPSEPGGEKDNFSMFKDSLSMPDKIMNASSFFDEVFAWLMSSRYVSSCLPQYATWPESDDDSEN